MKNNLTRYWPIGLSGLILLLAGCERFLEIDPPNSKIGKESVFGNERTAEGALKGIYRTMGSGFNGFANGYTGSVSINGALSADELLFVNNYGLTSPYEEINSNNISPRNASVETLWSNCYEAIYMINVLLEETADGAGISGVNRMRGEAYFLRAFTYFYLTNLFGPIPLAIGSDYRENARLPLSAQEMVYQLIINDLEAAEQLLPTDYTGMARATPNKAAAQAMLARVYLYLQDWERAEQYATEVIGQTGLYRMEQELDKVFSVGSGEAIWQRLPDEVTGNALEATLFFSNAQYTHGITGSLLGAFEPQDKRRVQWVYLKDAGTQLYVPYKYRVTGIEESVEYSVILRLAELYLIRAEARAQRDNPVGAIADLDVIRGRAGLALLQDTNPALAGQALIDSIFAERQRELFTEWGHRWLDLKRSGRAVEVLGPVKPGFTAADEWYPIPENEELRNPNMHQ